MHRLLLPRPIICAAFATLAAFSFPDAKAETPKQPDSATQAGESLIEGGRSTGGRYELRHASAPGSAVRLVNTETDSEIGRIALAQPRIANPGAPSCQAIWQAGGESFALLDHDHKYSTRLSIHTLFHGRLIALTVPDYIQNALGRVDATEATLPCWSRASAWNGDELPVALTVNAPDREGKWVLHRAAVSLRLLQKPGRLPEVKLESVKIEKTAAE